MCFIFGVLQITLFLNFQLFITGIQKSNRLFYIFMDFYNLFIWLVSCRALYFISSPRFSTWTTVLVFVFNSTAIYILFQSTSFYLLF